MRRTRQRPMLHDGGLSRREVWTCHSRAPTRPLRWRSSKRSVGRYAELPALRRYQVTQMKAKDATRNARYLWRCRGCKSQFTVKVGTIMEDSPIPCRFWCLAFYRAAASKKGVSALRFSARRA